MALLGIIVLAVVIVFWIVSIYNGLVLHRNGYKNAFTQIDIQLQRRYDLLPNLIETVKSSMAFEERVLVAVTEARTKAESAKNRVRQNPDNQALMGQLNAAESELAAGMSRFMAVAEAYPDFKSHGTIAHLMEELATTENKIAFARQAYNDSVMNYNNRREIFPNNLFASAFGFQSAVLLTLDDPKKREPIQVRLTA